MPKGMMNEYGYYYQNILILHFMYSNSKFLVNYMYKILLKVALDSILTFTFRLNFIYHVKIE